MRKNNLNHLFSIIIALSCVIGLVAPVSALAAPAQVAEQVAPAQSPAQTPTVEAELQQQINSDPQVGYLIYFRDKAELSSTDKMSWVDKGWFVMDALKSTAENSQANVLAYLDANHVQYQSFWIDNIIAVDASELNTFNGLFNFSEIETLRARRIEYLIDPQVIPVTEAPTTVEPNIVHVGAPGAWALGVTGAGMTVSSIDTGVRYTHNALVGHYRGNLGGGVFDHDYNWFDPYGDHPASPGDDNGHGSHTMGTMVGDDGGTNQIGMAPGAEWMACRGCNTSSCTDAALLACAQFIAAPTDLDGDNPDPAKRPNAVNNSWGDCGRAYDPWYQGVVDSWHAVGIYPIFSNGNSSNCGYTSPPPLNTVGNPARYGNVTGVGASGQSNGQYATFSNWGPTDNPDTVNPNPDDALGAALKPQVLAPGSNIRSSVNTSDTAYEGGWSGTSMSAPHVTGLVALMWSAAPCLVGDYAATENIIENTATPIPYNTGGSPPPPAGNDPNYATGHGEINALSAVTEALGSCGDSTLSGTVTDEVTTDPIQGALVLVTNGTDTRQTLTNETGGYTLSLFAGTYDVTVSAFGYLPTTVEGVEVSGATTLDIALTLAPNYVLSGQVTDGTTGWPLYASVSIDDYPDNPIWTDPATGQYSVNLPAGMSYQLTVNAFSSGYLPASVDSAVLNGDLTVDANLEVDEVACSAPGYILDVTGVYEPFNGTTTPAGWTVVNHGGACTWQFADPGGRGNLTGGSGNFAVADSDYCGSGTTMNTDLYSPVMDVSTLANLYLSFKYDYNNLVSTEQAAVDLSADGGSTWTNLVNWNTDQRGPAEFNQNVTAIAGGSTEAQLRFHYLAPGWDWWWEVDDVFMGEKSCVPIGGGGLVVGRVVDANDNHPLISATVSSDNDASTTTVAAADPAMGDFYTLFQPTGVHVLTAAIDHYNPATASVTVPLSDTIRQDFSLQAGHLVYTPASIDETIPAGSSTTVELTVQNIGGGVTTFSLAEVNKGAVPFGQTPPTTEPRTGLSASTARAPVRLFAGPWQPTGDVGLVLDDGSMEDSVGVNSSAAAFQFIWLNRFTPSPASFPFILDTVSVVWPTGQVSPGNAMQIVVYEDTDGDGDPSNATLMYTEDVTVQTADEAWNDYTLANPVALTGPGDVLIGFIDRFVNSGVTAPNYPAALDESSSTGRSWVGWWNADPPAQPILPPDNTFDIIDNLGIPGNWMVRGSGTTGGIDVPWLSESPTEVTLGPGESVTIDVTLDSATVPPGVNSAELRFVHDTPYSVPNLPVKMTASIPPTMGKLAGTVSTNGYCDSNPATLADVPVTINSAAFTQPLVVHTDANGYYYVWLDQSNSPLTIDVNAGPDYAMGSATGVVLNGGQTTIQDFTLRYLEPCLNAAPPSILVTIPLGTSTTKPLTLYNNGGATAVYSFTNTMTGYTPPATLNEPTSTITIGDLTFCKNPNPPTTSSDPNADYALKVNTGSTTITQSNSQTITSGNSVSCNAGGLHTDNHYLRVFDLPTFGINRPFGITNVSFGIEQSTPAGATQPVEVRLFTLEGAFQFANLTPIGSATAAVSSQSLTILDVPVTGTAPAGSKLVVDIFTPSGQSAGNSFFIGSNSLGETGPSYLAASDCGIPEPATTASIGFPEMMVVMNVTGVVGGGTGPALWLSENPTEGTVPSDGMQGVIVTFDANKVNAPGTYMASATVNSNDPQNQAIDVQTTMVVSAPANWGTLKGTISSLGYCDSNPAPLGGATVLVTGSNGMTREMITAVDGTYEFWLPDYGSPFTVQVSEPEHLPVSVGGIIVTGMGTTTQDLSLRWMRPCVTETPPELNATLEWQGSTTKVIDLSNTGATGTPFSISELPGTFIPMGIMGNQILVVNDGDGSTSATNAFTTALDNLGYTYEVVSSSSSTGIPADMFNYMTVLYAGVPSTGAEQDQLVAYLDGGGRLLIADDDFGYTDRATVLYQTYFQATYVADSGSDGVIHGVDLEAGTDVDISSDPYPDSFTIGPDAVGILANTAPRVNWAGMRIARETYKAVYFAWDYHYAGGSAVGDPIETEILGKVMPWMIAADVDWLSVTPDSGTLAANTGFQSIQVGFNAAAASVLQPGTYTAQLKIETEDPVTDTIYVPVTMVVNPSVTYGKLWGYVNGLGACDLNPAPIKGAQVIVIMDSVTTTLETDATGYYQYWLSSSTRTIGLEVSASGYLGENRALFFYPGTDPRNQQDFDLHWLQPCGALTPDSISVELTMGASTTVPAEIDNSGWAPLNFSFRAMSTGFVPMNGTQAGEDVLLVSSNSTIADALAASLTRMGFTYNRVTTSSLPPVETWNSYSAVIWAGSPTSSTNTAKIKSYLDGGGSFLISYNDFGYFYGDDTLYTDYLEAVYTGDDAGSDGLITGSDIMVGLHVNISADPFPDSFTLNGPNAVAIFTNDPPNMDDSALRIAKNGFKAIYLAWNFNYTGTTDAEKDAVLGKAMNWLVPTITWLQVDPNAGTVADHLQKPVTVTLDAGDPGITQPGVYLADLAMRNNTPGMESISIPVTMTVNPPATWGKLEGTVTGLGYCDKNPAPLANQEVIIQGADGFTHTLATDDAGYYQWWLTESDSPLTVTVSAADHTTGVVTGVAIVAGATTVQDFSLRWLKPCQSTTPTSLEATVVMGYSDTKTLSVNNNGAANLTWELQETTEADQLATVTPIIGSEGLKDKNAPLTVSRPGGYIHSFVPQATLIEEGFEAGLMPPVDWSLGITDPDYTWKISLSTPYEGLLAADIEYDPSLAQQDEVLLTPELLLQSGTLDFWSFGSVYWCRDTNDNCDLNVWIVIGEWDGGAGDDIYVGTADDDWTGTYVWSNSTFDLTTLLPGGPVRLGFQYYGMDGAQVAVDAILLDGELGIPYSDIPWLTEVPTHGVTLADSVFDVDVTFDSMTYTVGTYTGTLMLTSDDPVVGVLAIPVTMHVVSQVVPTASFTSNSPVFVGEEMVFTNTSTPGTPPEATFEWNFGDGTPVVPGTMSPITHLYDTAGRYTVSLEACNSAGCDTFTAQVVVNSHMLFLPLINKN